MADLETEVVVLGSGPGGYTAAFRAADLGKKVILIERFDNIGGVCLNVGCIPSKALLHAAKVIDEAEDMSAHGISFAKPTVDTKKLVSWKDSIITKLTGGLKALAKQRKVTILKGYGKFTSDKTIAVETDAGVKTVSFDNVIVAVGSKPISLPFLPDDPRIMDSTGALNLEDTNCNMLVLGGGIIGLEMATVYRALGAKISVVELMDSLMPGADKDLIKPFHKFVSKQYESIMLETKVTAVEAKPDGLWVTFEGKNAPAEPQRYDRILASVGRAPNGKLIDAEKAGINVDERGFIAVDKQMRTNVPHIFAIGDVVGQPMLAHKAVAEGRVAAEVIADKNHFFDPKCIPSVAYTDPEVAWTGVTETQAKEQGINYGTGTFPWMASGRALSNNRTEGLTKVIFDEDTNRVIGAGIVGPNAGELISEISLAIEMGCDAEDIALTIHPHPTLSESVAMATEIFEGTITDLYMPKKPKKLKEAG
ncbi:MAG: dihydrolipoyl dehydrogenase [Legionellales bacterium]|nr:dihydrolipoyl dehydrogenase [Legionellales bacterium]|tara:strand:- start:27632 stop:29068 length:1437 start_codon:yes stop_codon:yes gene_type:complete